MQRLEFKGMVRCTSLQNNADGNCEEIVNLRLDAGAWRVVGQKKAIVEGVDYEQVYVHKYGTFENFIGLKDGKVIWFASLEDGKVVEKNQEVCSVSEDVGFNQLNNILLVKDEVCIYKAIFKDGRYSSALAKLPDAPLLDVNVNIKSKKESRKAYLSFNNNNQLEIETFQKALYGLVKQCEAEGFYEGRVLICATYRLFDGSETKPTPPLLVDLGSYKEDAIQMSGTQWPNDRNPISVSSGTFWADIPVGRLNVKINNKLDAAFDDVVTGVNIYATLPYSFYDSERVATGAVVVVEDGVEKFSSMIPERKFADSDIETALFYKVASIDLKENGDEYKVIDFKNVTTNKTMSVDTSGWMDTTGNMFTYNNRLHLFGIRRKFSADVNLTHGLEEQYQIVTTQNTGPSSTSYNYDLANSRTLTAVFHLKMEHGDVRVVDDFRVELKRVDSSSGKAKYKVRLPRFWAFPDARAHKADLYDGRSFVKTVRLEPSSTYNYSFVLFEVHRNSPVRPSALSDDVDTRSNPNVPTVQDDSIVEYFENPVSVDLSPSLAYEDNMNLIVSEAMNPYYFPPAHSYLMPGEIVNLAVNTQQISASQIGQFPVYVFTTEGIYALQIGEGKVLYGNMIPISAEVALRGGAVLQTKYGILFVTDKGLKVIAGAEVTEVSKAVTGRLDLAYRDNEVYRRVMDHSKMGVRLQDCVSVVPFEEYAPGAVMGYDIVEDEVIVSNPAYRYSYVFSLGTKTWHKITDVFVGFNRHLGLQEYLAAPVSARARVDVACTVKPGYMQSYRWSVGIPDLTLPAGRTTISTDDKTLYNATATSPITLKEALGLLAVPKSVARYELAANKLYLSERSTRLYIRGNNVPPQSFPVANDPAELPVAPVGDGEIVRLTLAGREFSHTTQGTDTAATVAGEIAAFVRGCGFEAVPDEDGLFVLASPGAAGNGTQSPAVQSSPHVGLSVTPFSGGREAHPAKRVCDIREEDGALIPVYLQTRPVNLGGFGFKKVRHFYLSGELKPAPEKYHGLFLFASDDQETWTCVADAGFLQSTPRMILPPIGQTFRYFVVSTGGVVRPGHVVACVEVEEEGRYDNRLR